jgi:UrcA family protein
MSKSQKAAFRGAAGLISAALLFAAGPARSEPPVEIIAKPSLTRHVPYGDLSLATKSGQRMLYRRVGLAVGEVCPPTDDDGNWYDVQDCRNFAWRGARPQIRRAFDQALSGSSMAMTSITISVSK